jgi:PAS domain S-box-containing protein
MVVVNVAGEIVLLNVQAETQFGYSRDELLGRK